MRQPVTKLFATALVPAMFGIGVVAEQDFSANPVARHIQTVASASDAAKTVAVQDGIKGAKPAQARTGKPKINVKTATNDRQRGPKVKVKEAMDTSRAGRPKEREARPPL
jgi:hypothetical protein